MKKILLYYVWVGNGSRWHRQDAAYVDFTVALAVAVDNQKRLGCLAKITSSEITIPEIKPGEDVHEVLWNMPRD